MACQRTFICRKLEGAMKTLVFYIFNGISLNGQDFFIRQLVASGSDIFGLKFYAPWVFLLEVDLSVEAIYPKPAKDPIYLHNVDRQSFSQPIEGVQAVSRVYPLAGNTHAPRTQTEATGSTIAQRPRKRSRVLNDRELLVALHQKQDKHHYWLKRQMQSLLVDANRIRNLATKNAFVTHETRRRS